MNPFPLDKTASEWCKENIGERKMKEDGKIEILNAVIESASINIERGGILAAWLHLKLQNGFNQGFGGYALYLDKSFKHHKMESPAGHFIYRCLEIAGVDQWDKLKGKTIRVCKEKVFNSTIEAIGHIVNDDWFSPREDFKDVG